MKWYYKILLAFAGIIAFAVLMAVVEKAQTGEVLWKDVAPGKQGEQTTYTIELPANSECSLVVSPYPASGEGEPDIHLDVKMTDPDGKMVLSIGSDVLFGGPFVQEAVTTGRSYSSIFGFRTTSAGTYTLDVVPVSDKIKDIHLAVGLKKGSE